VSGLFNQLRAEITTDWRAPISGMSQAQGIQSSDIDLAMTTVFRQICSWLSL
jgi:hypothetical protein